jgi:predicted phage-related endonuclease
MITNHDRSGWIGASDAKYVIGNWKTKTFEKWWMQKLGINRDHFDNDATLAGTNWEHKILDSLGYTDMEKDRQILVPEIRLRVNLDGNTPGRIYECKTYKADAVTGAAKELRNGICPKGYWMQVQVQMYASRIYGADIVAYGLVNEDYNNYMRAVDPGRRKLIPVTYDPNWIENEYLPRHRKLCEALVRGVFPSA